MALGKVLLLKKIFERLEEKFGKESVVLADITNLKGSPKQEKLYNITKIRKIDDEHLDKIYVAGVNRAYEEIIIPALKEGKIVVVDRSEIDLLRHAIESGDQEAIKKREGYIQDGTPTHRLWAGNRIFIDASPDDILLNLSEREKLSKYDPKNLAEVNKRISAQKEAENKILAMKHLNNAPQIIRKNNIRTNSQNPKIKQAYLNKLTDEIIDNLNLSIE